MEPVSIHRVKVTGTSADGVGEVENVYMAKLSDGTYRPATESEQNVGLPLLFEDTTDVNSAVAKYGLQNFQGLQKVQLPAEVEQEATLRNEYGEVKQTVGSGGKQYDLRGNTWVDQETGEAVTDQGIINNLNDFTTSIPTETSTGQPLSGGGDPADATVPNSINITENAEALIKSPIFQELPEDQQEIVQQVYTLIAENNKDQANQLVSAFQAAAEVSNPFFRQQLRLAIDSVERGFVSIDEEEAFKLEQIKRRKQDLEEDIATQQEFLSLEEISTLRGIDREFDQQLKNTRQNLAARGMSQSSRRTEVEELLEETTGDLRESTTRKFGIQQLNLTRELDRSQRDIEAEVARLKELTNEEKLGLFRDAEATLGTDNLPDLNIDADPLGDIVGDIPQRRTQDIVSGAQNLIF